MIFVLLLPLFCLFLGQRERSAVSIWWTLFKKERGSDKTSLVQGVRHLSQARSNDFISLLLERVTYIVHVLTNLQIAFDGLAIYITVQSKTTASLLLKWLLVGKYPYTPLCKIRRTLHSHQVPLDRMSTYMSHCYII